MTGTIPGGISTSKLFIAKVDLEFAIHSGTATSYTT
jgi:hypothetical protein